MNDLVDISEYTHVQDVEYIKEAKDQSDAAFWELIDRIRQVWEKSEKIQGGTNFTQIMADAGFSQSNATHYKKVALTYKDISARICLPPTISILEAATKLNDPYSIDRDTTRDAVRKQLKVEQMNEDYREQKVFEEKQEQREEFQEPPSQSTYTPPPYKEDNDWGSRMNREQELAEPSETNGILHNKMEAYKALGIDFEAFTVSQESLRVLFKHYAKMAHSDLGGSDELMKTLNSSKEILGI